MSTLLASELLKLFSCKTLFHVQHCLFQPLIIVFQEMRYPSVSILECFIECVFKSCHYFIAAALLLLMMIGNDEISELMLAIDFLHLLFF